MTRLSLPTLLLFLYVYPVVLAGTGLFVIQMVRAVRSEEERLPQVLRELAGALVLLVAWPLAILGGIALAVCWAIGWFLETALGIDKRGVERTRGKRN